MVKKIYLGADHAGFKLKEKVKRWLDNHKVVYEDLGNLVYDKDDDYPDFALKVTKKTVKEGTKGILFCGSAEGMCIAANKIKGARAINPHNAIQAKFARNHEDANILCLAGGESSKPQPKMSIFRSTKIITTFLKTPFSNAVRHKRRLEKIKKLEK